MVIRLLCELSSLQAQVAGNGAGSAKRNNALPEVDEDGERGRKKPARASASDRIKASDASGSSGSSGRSRPRAGMPSAILIEDSKALQAILNIVANQAGLYEVVDDEGQM